ncbi:MAG TPA: phosphoglucosamine mutase [Chitinophagales bacterium]|nr:phosphoglucosamine mutase [Chitinophagales bacterium]
MTLIKSISGIRGTIGGRAGNNLTPEDIVKFTAAFGAWVQRRSKSRKIVIGRDARPSGEMVSSFVATTLKAMGINVVDLGLSTTPTVELAVVQEKAAGGIIITASHNPVEWNALKLLNNKGEFISEADGKELLLLAGASMYEFASVDKLGSYTKNDTYLHKHIEKILALKLVNTKAIRAGNYRIVVDAVNSSGGIAIPELLKALGVEMVFTVNCEPTGQFAHNPEPLPENLKTLAGKVKIRRADLGIAVDPDVDRLALVCEDGSMFGEEYTLVAVADYVLKNKLGNTVSNLSSTRALRDITEKAGGGYSAAAVGEVNVVQQMKAVNAVIGGEGNGGIIYPELHYGRDALVGVALFLSHLATSGLKCSALRASYPAYVISKNKIQLTPEVNIDRIFENLQKKYSGQPINTEDGLKIEFENNTWIHLRRSNTEPIIRIYAEAKRLSGADALAKKIMKEIATLS